MIARKEQKKGSTFWHISYKIRIFVSLNQEIRYETYMTATARQRE